MSAILLILSAALNSTHLDLEFVQLFSAKEFRYTGDGYQDRLFKYRLFVPDGHQASYPLIVWLHGRGTASDDNVRQLLLLEELIFLPPRRADRFPFYLLAVQCPTDNPVWTKQHSVDKHHDDMVDVVQAILQHTLETQPIDRDRVYLTGASSGGSGCWHLAARYPEYFAAVAPLASSGGGDRLSPAGLQQLPIWAFHSKYDMGTPIGRVKRVVNRLNESGGRAHLTEIDSESHNCWSAAFHEHHLLEWLLAQRRGELGLPPGSYGYKARLKGLVGQWQWWEALLQVCLFASIGGLIWNAIRIHRLRHS